MPIIQSNSITLNNLVYSTGYYVNPPWVISLAPNKVGSGIAQWNASQIRGYPIYTGIPTSGQVLSWTSSGWFPSGVTSSSAATFSGVSSFNSRTGVVTLTSADVTGALTYKPYNNTNPSGYISSGYYTASGGVVLNNSNFSLSGVGKLHELNFDNAVKIGTNYVSGDDTNTSESAIFIGVNAGAATAGNGSVYIGYGAGTHNNGGYNIGIGYISSYSTNGSHCIEIDTTASTRVNTDYDIHIQNTIGGNTSTRRLSFGDIVMAPDANVHVISTESTTVPFIAKGAVSQTANLIEARASDDFTLFYVDSGGYISTPSSGLATWNASQLKGYAVSGNVPATGQVLTWNGNSWYAADITAGGDHIIGDIYASPSGKIFTGNVLLNGAISGVLSNTTITPIDSTPYASGDCIKYIIKAKYGSAVQATEVLVVSNGTDSYMTEYGVLYSSGKLLNVSADLNSSNIRLLGQATYSNTSIHMMKVLIS